MGHSQYVWVFFSQTAAAVTRLLAHLPRALTCKFTAVASLAFTALLDFVGLTDILGLWSVYFEQFITAVLVFEIEEHVSGHLRLQSCFPIFFPY